MARNAHILSNALPQLVEAEKKLSGLAKEKGIEYDIAPFGAVRSQADTIKILGYREQEYKLYVDTEKKAGRIPLEINKWRPIAPFGNSHHNYGAAFDIRIVSAPSGMSFSQALEVVGSLAGQAGLRWGKSFGDLPHFELPLTLASVKKLWEETGKKVGVGASPVMVVSAVAILGLLLFTVRKWAT